MNRRAFLSGAGGSLVAASGCLDAVTDRPLITDDSMEAIDRGCGARRNTGSPDYDEATDRLSIEGVLAGTRKSGGLGMSYAHSGAEHKVFVEVHPTGEAQSSSCERYYEYEATVSFRETPPAITVTYADPHTLVGTVILEAEEPTTNTTT